MKRDTTKILMEIKNAMKEHEKRDNTHTVSVLQEAEERICYMNDLLEKAAEEIENIYGKETELTEKIREILIDNTDEDYRRSDIVNWIIHYVFAGENDPEYLADAHTHGLNYYKHPELMTVLNLPQNVCGSILNNLGIRIARGERFDEEKIYTNIIANNLPVKLVKENIDGNDIMVLIFPDANGFLPEDEGCDEPYNKQLEYLEYIKKNRY